MKEMCFVKKGRKSKVLKSESDFIWEHEIADVTKKARIYTILSEIFTLCLCF